MPNLPVTLGCQRRDRTAEEEMNVNNLGIFFVSVSFFSTHLHFLILQLCLTHLFSVPLSRPLCLLLYRTCHCSGISQSFQRGLNLSLMWHKTLCDILEHYLNTFKHTHINGGFSLSCLNMKCWDQWVREPNETIRLCSWRKNRGSPLGVSLQLWVTPHAQEDKNLSDVIVSDSAVDP